MSASVVCISKNNSMKHEHKCLTSNCKKELGMHFSSLHGVCRLGFDNGFGLTLEL